MKHNQTTCYCNAYNFPHRKHSGKCVSCKHGYNWLGLPDALEDVGEWCNWCAEMEGYYNPPSETLSPYERNPGLVKGLI